MEFVYVILIIIGLVWSILQIILFFKVWGMCNDVAAIKARFEISHPTQSEQHVLDLVEKTLPRVQEISDNTKCGDPGFKVGDAVCYEPMNRNMIIKEFTADGMLVCVSYKQAGKEEYEGKYKPEQVKKL